MSMKKITLRLSDIEAEALERIAYVEGESQNRAICKAIANEYCRLDGDAIRTSRGTLRRVSVLLCRGIMERYVQEPNDVDVDILLNACSYDLEHDQSEEDKMFVTWVQEAPEAYLTGENVPF